LFPSRLVRACVRPQRGFDELFEAAPFDHFTPGAAGGVEPTIGEFGEPALLKRTPSQLFFDGLDARDLALDATHPPRADGRRRPVGHQPVAAERLDHLSVGGAKLVPFLRRRGPPPQRDFMHALLQPLDAFEPFDLVWQRLLPLLETTLGMAPSTGLSPTSRVSHDVERRINAGAEERGSHAAAHILHPEPSQLENAAVNSAS